MDKVYVIGVGQPRFFRHKSETEPVLARKSVEMALLDAGLAWSDLQDVVWAPSGDVQSPTESPVPPFVETPLTLVPCFWSGGVRGSVSLHLAFERILSGKADVVAAVASGKLANADAPADAPVSADEDLRARLELEAEAARRHIERFQTTPEHLARIASKNRLHGSMNPRAFTQDPISIEGVLGDEEIASPLTRAMCAMPSDGAAAVIACSGRFVRKLGRPSPVRILASVAGGNEVPDAEGEEAISRWCSRAFGMAGFGPGDVDIAELDDTSAYSELRLTEIVGLCAAGEGGPFAWSGATSLGGNVPVNTSGGMVARGDGGSASGLAQVHEIVTQLRGNASERQAKGIRIGLAVSCRQAADNKAAAAIHLFQKV